MDRKLPPWLSAAGLRRFRARFGPAGDGPESQRRGRGAVAAVRGAYFSAGNSSPMVNSGVNG